MQHDFQARSQGFFVGGGGGGEGAYVKNWDQIINVGMIHHGSCEDTRAVESFKPTDLLKLGRILMVSKLSGLFIL